MISRFAEYVRFIIDCEQHNATPPSLNFHCMSPRVYAKSNPVLIRSGGPSDSTRFIRKRNSVTKGRKEGRNLRGYGCHISVTAGR